jgi:hypothetical protein
MSQAAASPTDEAVAAALRWLSQDDYAARHNQILSERVPGVSEDLVSSDQFQEWLTGEQPVSLCLRGQDTENTIATSMVVETLFENFGSDLNIGIAFVYPYSMRENPNPENLLRIMLLQLGQRSPAVQPTLVDFHHRSNNNELPPSTQDLLDTLEDVISKISKVYLVIDSLKYLSSADGLELLPGLRRLQNRLQVNLLATSMDQFQRYGWFSTIDTSDTVKEYRLRAYVHRRFCGLPSTVVDDFYRGEGTFLDSIQEISGGL